MKIDELISELKEVKEEHGNLETHYELIYKHSSVLDKEPQPEMSYYYFAIKSEHSGLNIVDNK